MSTIPKDKNAYLVPLFGRADDMRVKLFIDELRNQFDAKTQEYVAITKYTEIFENQYFENRDAATKDESPHSEWEIFLKDLSVRLNKKKVLSSSTDTNDIAIINIIKKVNFPPSTVEDKFVVALIKTLFTNFNGTSVSIYKVDTWKNVTEVEYRTPLCIDIIRAISPVTAIPNEFTFFNFSYYYVYKSLNGNSLQAFFKRNINWATVVGTPTHTDSGAKEFGYRYDKYWLKMLIETHAANAITPVTVSKFFDDASVPSEQVYYRKGASGELYTRNASGAEIRVDYGSDEAKKLTAADKCMGTGLDDNTAVAGEKCADYLRDCLSGKDIIKCKAYLEKADFWEKAQDEVGKMLPAIAVQTLNAFEFGMESVWDNTANCRLLKYKSVESWVANLASHGIIPVDVEKITKNVKLLGYLAMLVKKVNSNPAILNKDYLGETDSAIINNLDAFTGSRLANMGIKARVVNPNHVTVSSVDKLSDAITRANDTIKLTIGLPGLHGYSNNILLRGGATTLETFEENVTDITKQTANIMSLHISALILRLKKYNKEISKEDTDKIMKLIESLKNSEEKLNKAILYTEKYARLLEIHGQKDNTNILSMDHLKEFVDNRNRYFIRVAKKQNDLMSIIRSIAEAVNKETPIHSNEMKPLNVDTKTVDFKSLL